MEKFRTFIRYFKKICFSVLFFGFLHDQTAGCRLWSVLSKDGSTLSQLSPDEKILLYGQLNSFFLQSRDMPNGWSLLDYPYNIGNNVSPIIRSENNAISDSSRYWEIVDSLILNSSSKISMGHLRMASSGALNVPNPHPWMFYADQKSYSFMHNGTINKDLLFNLITNNGLDLSWLHDNEPNTFNGSYWQGEGWFNVVDSELLMLYIMQQISNQNDIYLGLQLALSNLMQHDVMAIQLNLILSDGNSLYCFGGTNGLSYAESSEHYVIMTQPENGGSLTWTGLNNGELVVISDSSLNKYPNFIQLTSEEDVFIPKSSLIMTQAFPNPFNGSVQFSVYDTFNAQDIEISIYDLSGKIVDEIFLRNTTENNLIKWIPPNSISTGTYFITARGNNSSLNQKILFIK